MDGKILQSNNDVKINVNRKTVNTKLNNLYKKIWRYRYIYLMILPAIIYFAVFTYAPIYGLQIAFKKFDMFKGMGASPWVGMEHFKFVFSSERFYIIIKNTLLISFYKIFWGFPVPIIFAILLNEVRNMTFKKTIQTVTYFPHFLSWVVFSGIVFRFFGPNGIINDILQNLGLNTIGFMEDPRYFRSVLVFTETVKGFGWASIIYLATIAGIDQQLYEAAKVDGAKKLRQIWHVTLPGMRPTIILLLMMNISNVLNAGFDQIFMLYNPAVYNVSDILDTYVYRVGLQNYQYEVATAVGLFKSVVGMTLIVTSNYFVRKYEGRSLW